MTMSMFYQIAKENQWILIQNENGVKNKIKE